MMVFRKNIRAVQNYIGNIRGLADEVGGALSRNMYLEVDS
jgi:hypothetical protein